MGIIIGRFRKGKSTYEVLEKIENEIVSIEEFRRNTEQAQKKIVGRFLLLAILVYLSLAVILYLYYNHFTRQERLICAIPLITVPVLIYYIKRILTWYYNRRIKKKQTKLVSLKEEKKKMLDKVMETETYKVAKSILEKFGNDTIKKAPTEGTPFRGNISTIPSSLTGPTGLRQRSIGPPSQLSGRVSFGVPHTPVARPTVGSPASTTIVNRPSLSLVRSATPARQQMALRDTPGTPRLMPRGILPKDRSVLDKMVDFLVGDGPSNRYALICRQCSSHNGMALKEEFEYLSFKCCYCFAFNPAKKKKPSAPKLDFDVSKSIKHYSDTSDSEKNSSTDSDSPSSKPIIPEPRSDSPDTGKLSDFDKLSDLELKNSDTESSPMDVDLPVNSETTANQGTNSDNKIDSEDVTENISATEATKD